MDVVIRSSKNDTINGIAVHMSRLINYLDKVVKT